MAATDCVLQSLVREDFEKILGPLRKAIEANHNRRILERFDRPRAGFAPNARALKPY